MFPFAVVIYDWRVEIWPPYVEMFEVFVEMFPFAVVIYDWRVEIWLFDVIFGTSNEVRKRLGFTPKVIPDNKSVEFTLYVKFIC